MASYYVSNGGKVIASGGFGCVFLPSLKCKNKNRIPNNISKLMTIKNAISEYEDITQFKPILEKIPNYTNYFLVNDINICEPNKLTSNDLKDFNIKCKALNKEGFTSKNINSSLNKMLLLNMPYGGLDVEDFIYAITKQEQFINLNNSLIKLLTNGIKPMNTLNIFHCDIKSSNVVVEKKIFNTKLIDWGLSCNYNGIEIPEQMLNRPFQFNLPFSCILFNELFLKNYEDFLKNNSNPQLNKIRLFISEFIPIWIEKRGQGHIKYMAQILQTLFKTNNMEVLYYNINEYLSNILFFYTKNGDFQIMEYFNNVYLKIIDIWGFIMIYYPILRILYNSYNNLNKNEIELYNKLKNIFMNYLYKNSIEPINILNLVNDLKNLNKSYKIKYIKNSSIRMSSLIKTFKNKNSMKNKKTLKIKNT